MTDKAVFLDRDGTLIEPVHYPSHPDQIHVFDGVASQLRQLQEAGWHLIVITNQSGLARGYFDTAALERMHDRLRGQLARQHVALDAIYSCPHHPDGTVPELATDCVCRKPQPAMLLQAAEDFGLDLRGSWMIGDILDDVEAGLRAGCRTVLTDLGTESPPLEPVRTPDYIARNTLHALRIVQFVESLGEPTEMNYLPARWSNAPVETSMMRKEVTNDVSD